MRYAKARLSERRREEVYRIYVTDTLRLIGRIDGERYIDFVEGGSTATELKPDEVVSKIRGKLAG